MSSFCDQRLVKILEKNNQCLHSVCLNLEKLQALVRAENNLQYGTQIPLLLLSLYMLYKVIRYAQYYLITLVVILNALCSLAIIAFSYLNYHAPRNENGIQNPEVYKGIYFGFVVMVNLGFFSQYFLAVFYLKVALEIHKKLKMARIVEKLMWLISIACYTTILALLYICAKFAYSLSNPTL